MHLGEIELNLEQDFEKGFTLEEQENFLNTISGIKEICHKYRVGLLSYSPLGGTHFCIADFSKGYSTIKIDASSTDSDSALKALKEVINILEERGKE